MSRSKHPRKQRDRKLRPGWWDGGWILESNKEQRTRLNKEVKKVLKDPEYEVILERKGPKNAFDYP